MRDSCDDGKLGWLFLKHYFRNFNTILNEQWVCEWLTLDKSIVQDLLENPLSRRNLTKKQMIIKYGRTCLPVSNIKSVRKGKRDKRYTGTILSLPIVNNLQKYKQTILLVMLTVL
jgi:hypothetical protein